MNETIGLKSIAVKFLRRWKLFLTVFIISFIPAILYLVITPRTYEFAAAVQIVSDNNSGIGSIGFGEAAGLMKSFGIGGSTGSINVEDEMAVLTSNRLLRKVTLDLGLNVTYSKSWSLYNMYDDSPLKLTADSTTMQQLNQAYAFKVSAKQGKITVNGETFSSLPAKIKAGKDIFTLDYTSPEDAQKEFDLEITCSPASWIAESLNGSIIIDELSKSANVLTLAYIDHSKQRGLDILNTLVNDYNNDIKTYLNRQDIQTLDFVNNRLANVVKDLEIVELNIRAFKQQNDITLIESDLEMYSGVLRDIQTAIIETESQSSLITMLDEFMKDPANKYDVIPSLMTIADGEKGGTIGEYNKALIKRDQLLRAMDADDTPVKDAENTLNKLRQAISVMIDNTKKSYDMTIKDLKSKEKQLLAKRQSIPAKEYEYLNFRRNQEILQGLYLLLLQKKEETELSLGKTTERARFIEPAFVKRKPVAPRKLYALIAIMALTLIIPVGIILSKELFVALKEEYNK
ncbi:MAG: tyrosine protein kinase [Tannerella sp.]|jgi:uncharacterized protein involved in exopolysaccharide biosynthesis|nr:tyrosine protein kinase [Tannerella sp.]